MKPFFYRILISLFFLGLAKAHASNPVFKTEFSCYSQLAGVAILTDTTRTSSYYFPPVTKDPEKLMAVEERLDKKKVARLYFFTEHGGYSYTVNQVKPAGIQEYHFLIKVDELERKIAMDRIQTSKTNEIQSLVYSPEEVDHPIKLPEERGEKMRKILIKALEEKVQNVKATFSARVELRRKTLASLIKSDLRIQDKTMPLETYFETLPEKTKGQIAARQHLAEYLKGLNDCRQALGADQKFGRLKELIDAELLKFSTVPELKDSRPADETGTQ